MIFDPISRSIYVYGGWDGSKDLSDLWRYSLEEGSWRCMCRDSSAVVSQCGCAIAGFHLATKIWGGSTINELVYLARQVTWDIFLGEFL